MISNTPHPPVPLFARHCRALLTIGVIFLLTTSVVRAESWTGPWKPWIELGGLASTELSYGEVALFLPKGNDTTLAFLDLRAKAFTDDAELEGNFAGGMRHMLAKPVLGQNWNLGLWVGGDIRRSASDNTFSQLSTGVEALSADWDVRFNGYAPVSDPKTTRTARRGLAKVTVSGS